MRIASAPRDRGLIEESRERVILTLRQRIVFVIVTATAVEGQPHPDRAHRFSHIENVIDAVLFWNASPFAIDGIISQEAGRENLLFGRIGQKITRNLPNSEVIIRDVFINRLDDPIPPRPHRALAVALVAITIGIARGIQPRPRKALPKSRVRNESVNQIPPSFG